LVAKLDAPRLAKGTFFTSNVRLKFDGIRTAFLGDIDERKCIAQTAVVGLRNLCNDKRPLLGANFSVPNDHVKKSNLFNLIMAGKFPAACGVPLQGERK
jgi:hypothetical protein